MIYPIQIILFSLGLDKTHVSLCPPLLGTHIIGVYALKGLVTAHIFKAYPCKELSYNNTLKL